MRRAGFESKTKAEDLSGLSEDERRAFGAVRGKGTIKTAGEQETVTKFRFDHMKKDLEDRISRLEKKAEDASKELKDIREDRDRAVKRADKAEKAVSEKDLQIEELKKDIVDKDRTIAELQKKGEQNPPEKETPRERSLNQELVGLKKRYSELETDLEYSHYLIDEMMALWPEPEEEPSAPERAAVPEGPSPVGTAVRSGPSEIRSNLFVLPRYRAALARSGKYISFEPDVNGRAVCRDGTMTLPALEGLIGYRGREEYPVFRDGNRLIAHLV